MLSSLEKDSERNSDRHATNPGLSLLKRIAEGLLVSQILNIFSQILRRLKKKGG